MESPAPGLPEDCMTLLRPTATALIALTIAGSHAHAAAPASRDVPSAIQQYVRARAADAAGLTELAAAGYGAALAATPNDPLVAMRAYRQAMMAGDRALALRAANVLVSTGKQPPDVRMLLLTEAVSAKNWAGAATIVDQIEQDQVFAFAAPALRAWIARGSGKGDPLAALDGARKLGGIAAAYAAEHRALMLLATGRRDEGVAAVRSMIGPGGRGAVRLRITAAAALVKAGDRAAALDLLEGEEPLLGLARSRINDRKSLPPAVTGAADGIADLFTRVAVDINRERVTPIALSFARLATFLAPRDAETWLVTSELLTAAEQYGTALAVLDNIRADSPFAEAARNQRLELLVRQGEREKALAEALAATRKRDVAVADWTRVGGLYGELERPRDAADAYGRALALHEAQPDDGSRWTILLMLGGALHEAGDWPAARAALEKAHALAPDEAVVLNYLGYALLERREDLPEAQALIEKASKIRPEDAAITDSLGWSHYVRGDLPKAIELLERAVISQPGEPTLNEHLGDAYWTAGRKMEARFAWRAALVHADAKDTQRISTKIDMGWTPEVAAP
ncbi:hypothetical protein KC8_01195 [Sphingomonas sp. KC8]|nr:hypothetical protein KC8_01195 [Sphingomonas sp. KC8]